jgi:hypothetical protein
VITWEELRVEEHLRDIGSKRNKEVHCWSVTTGMQKSGAAGTGQRPKGMADPIEALDIVIEHKEPAIYLFKDFHPFMRARESNVAVVRKLREVAIGLSDSYKTLVITSPVLDIAPELEKDVTVLDYPLPDVRRFRRDAGTHLRGGGGNHAKVTVKLDARTARSWSRRRWA